MNGFSTARPTRSEPSGRIAISTIVFEAVALSLFVVAGLGWHCGWVQEHLRKPVLEQPIRFEEGFSVTSSFFVAYAHYYWVEVVCPRTNGPHMLDRALPVKFSVTCDGQVVAQGDSPHHDEIYSAAEDTRIMAGFKGEPGKRYDFSFRTVGVMPALDATKPSVRISSLSYQTSNLIYWIFSDTSPAWVIAGVGALFAVWPCRILIRKSVRPAPHAT